MLFGAQLPQRFAELGFRISQAARERLGPDGEDDIKHAAEAARRRIERLRFRSDVAYAEHVIARAIREGRASGHRETP